MSLGAFVFLFFVVLVVLSVTLALVIKRHRSTPPSLVNPMVRKALNDDLDRTMTKAEVDRVKHAWMEADGWEMPE